jgi:hypothetical protein
MWIQCDVLLGTKRWTFGIHKTWDISCPPETISSLPRKAVLHHMVPTGNSTAHWSIYMSCITYWNHSSVPICDRRHSVKGCMNSCYYGNSSRCQISYQLRVRISPHEILSTGSRGFQYWRLHNAGGCKSPPLTSGILRRLNSFTSPLIKHC